MVDHGISIADAQRSVDQYLIDGFQQSAHDLFWDTTWPICPIHLRHPLWFDESQQAWCCQQDGIAVAELGDLAKLRPPAT